MVCVICVCGLGLTGCEQDSIQVYTVPKEPPASNGSATMPANHPDIAPPAGMPRVTWATPAGWTELPAGDFRVASFKITGSNNQQADVSVIPLPGDAGGDL